MEWLIIWLLFGIASGIVGSKKGRSGFGWFLIGVLLGPFGILFAFIASDLNKAKAEAAAEEAARAESAASKKCPFCAETIKADAIVCRYCGRDLPKPTRVEQKVSMDERFDAWLRSQNPPIIDPTPEQRAEYRKAFDWKVAHGEL